MRQWIGAFAGISLSVVAGTAAAATWQVDTTIDSADPALQACTAAASDCSLRGAIIKANTTAGADTVKVPAGTYPLTVLGYEDAGLAGDLDITDALTLKGLGAGAIIDATASDSGVMHALAPLGTTVTLRNLVLTGGHGAPGAGLYVQSGAVMLDNTLILGNSADSNSGGGIYNLATLTLSQSTVSDNYTLFDGGGVYNGAGAVFSATESTFEGNVSDRQGGAFINFGACFMTSSVVAGNSGAQTGGGIDNRGDLTLDGTIVDGNSSAGAAGYPQGAGGILNYGDAASLVLIGSTISNNTALAGWGGGVVSYYGSTLDASAGTAIVGNSALYSGGLDLRGPSTLTDAVVADNVATLDGGGIFAGGNGVAITLTNTAVTGNSAGNSGGGLWLSGGQFRLVGCDVSDNSAAIFGGGLYQLDNPQPNLLDVRDSTVNGNVAGNEGGGIFTYTSYTRLQRVTVSGNSSGEGGGIKSTDSKLIVLASTVSGNQVTGNGGGIANDDDGFEPATVSMTNSTVSGNIAGGEGGGISNDFDGGIAQVYLFSVTVAANDALASASDGIFVDGGQVTTRNTIVSGQVTAGADCRIVGGGAVVDPGNNLEQGGSCGFAIGGVAPGIGALASNGGPTATHALLMGSPAIAAAAPAACRGDQNGDGVPDVVLATDQRGMPRAAVCDIGAFDL